MTFLSTPEKLLGRNDSKNPATTCRGITSSGRPCRRALAVSKLANQDTSDGMVAMSHENGRLGDAQLYCWQHKDQWQPSSTLPTVDENKPATRPPRRRTQVFESKNRNSIDSLMQNLNIQDELKASQRPHAETDSRPQQNRPPRQPTQARQPSSWHSLCCMIATDEQDDRLEIVRHKHRIQQGRVDVARLPAAQRPRPSANQISAAVRRRPNQPLTYIKAGTHPQVAATLLAELAKPISATDEEGYIYMFWLTPASFTAPQEHTAKSLLLPRSQYERRLSDVMTEFSVPDDEPQRRGGASNRKIMLKIGRANNVTRRMNEWQRQCGYELSLVRWYPHISHSANPSPERRGPDQVHYPDLSEHGRPDVRRDQSKSVRKVPFVKRVERLIHLELTEHQVKQQCTTCGREHREWFKIEATEQGVRQVDEVVRRWVNWGEQHM